MKPTRRKTVLGLGALATGSGAVFSSAAFSNSAQADADFRVRVSEALRVEAGDSFNDDGTVAASPPNDKKFINPVDSGDSGTGDNFYNSGELGSVFSSTGQDESPPLATVSARDENAVSDPAFADVNGDLAIFVALDEGDSTTDFSGLLQITNNTSQDQNVGIAYDGNNSQYGSDAENANITTKDIQQVYQFKTGGTLISPDPSETGGGASDNTSAGWSGDAEDAPANTVTVSSSGTVQIKLETDVDQITDLAAQAGLSPGFGEDSTAVDLLNGITVVAEPQ